MQCLFIVNVNYVFLSSLKGFGFRDRELSVLADEVLPAGAGAVPESVTSYKNRKNGILNTFFTLLQNFWTGEERERERDPISKALKYRLVRQPLTS